MQETQLARFEKILLYFMLIFSCLAYLGYFIYAKQHGIPLLISYSRSSRAMMSSGGLLTLLFRFGKEVCAVLLFIVEMVTMNRTTRAKIIVAIFLISAYGTIVALAENLTLQTMISGYRMMLFFAVLAMFFNGKTIPKFSLKVLMWIISVLLVVNTVVAAWQAFDSLKFNVTKIGQGSYRFMGFLPAAAAFAFFCLGAVLFAYCIEITTNGSYHGFVVFISVVAFIGAYLSGTRSSLINMLIIIFAFIVKRADIKKSQKLIVSLILAIPAAFFIIQFATSVANRGSIMENALGGGRISIFMDNIFGRPMVNIFFGNGIGAGSNSAATFSSSSSDNLLFLDGTFTVILYQFGLAGFMVCVALIWGMAKKIHQKVGALNMILFMATVVLQCLTTNILEAFALLIMLFLCYYTLIFGKDIYYNFDSEREKA